MEPITQVEVTVTTRDGLKRTLHFDGADIDTYSIPATSANNIPVQVENEIADAILSALQTALHLSR